MKLVRFIRESSGLSKAAVMKQFEDYLRDNRLSSTQISFIQQMITFYTEKGRLDVATLYEPPFDFLDQDGIEGVFKNKDNIVDDLIERVRKLNEVG
jgi:type I restriction enzyme R subunit